MKEKIFIDPKAITPRELRPDEMSELEGGIPILIILIVIVAVPSLTAN